MKAKVVPTQGMPQTYNMCPVFAGRRPPIHSKHLSQGEVPTLSISPKGLNNGETPHGRSLQHNHATDVHRSGQ